MLSPGGLLIPPRSYTILQKLAVSVSCLVIDRYIVLYHAIHTHNCSVFLGTVPISALKLLKCLEMYNHTKTNLSCKQWVRVCYGLIALQTCAS